MRSLATRIDRIVRLRPPREHVRSPEEHADLCAALGIPPDWVVVGGNGGGYVLLPPEVEP